MGSPIKIFISHAHDDQNLAVLLIDYLLSEYELTPNDIRCTSVPGYTIPLGESIVDCLRKDVSVGIGFIALLSHFGLESVWVKFELGAAWGSQKAVLPILGPGVEDSDKRLGPFSYMPCVKIEDVQCTKKLDKYFGQLMADLNVSSKPQATDGSKIQLFIDSYRQWGGSHADFSQTYVSIINPVEGSTVIPILPIKIYIEKVPENGFIWVGIMDTNAGLTWPKETLQNSQRSGEHSIEIIENGRPEPGTLAVSIIGVGPSGNAKLENWREKAEKAGSWPGIRQKDIPGAVELTRSGGLTLIQGFHH